MMNGQKVHSMRHAYRATSVSLVVARLLRLMYGYLSRAFLPGHVLAKLLHPGTRGWRRTVYLVDTSFMMRYLGSVDQ